MLRGESAVASLIHVSLPSLTRLSFSLSLTAHVWFLIKFSSLFLRLFSICLPVLLFITSPDFIYFLIRVSLIFFLPPVGLFSFDPSPLLLLPFPFSPHTSTHVFLISSPSDSYQFPSICLCCYCPQFPSLQSYSYLPCCYLPLLSYPALSLSMLAIVITVTAKKQDPSVYKYMMCPE